MPIQPPVSRVEAAIAYIFDNDVKRLFLSARGTVPHKGWTHPQLEERIYVNPPADGILEFDFTATPPLDAGACLPSPVASSVITRPEPWFRGVRIYGQFNMIEPEVVPGAPTP